MSCEQLRAEIDEKRGTVPSGSKDKSYLLASAIALDDGCPNNRAELTHTSRMLNAERNAEIDRIWQDAKEKAEALLKRL